MRWPVFAVAAYLLLVLDVSVASAMRLEVNAGIVEPQFLLVLLVFVGLSASPSVVLLAAGVLGLLVDATTTWPTTTEHYHMTLIGPYALGYLAGATVLLQVRAMVYQHHPLAYAVMIVLAGMAVHLVVLGIFAVRLWYDPMPGFSAAGDLWLAVLTVAYSAAVGAVLSVGLVLASPLFDFTPTRGRTPKWRK